MAQLGARVNGIHEVTGSNPVSSTRLSMRSSFVCITHHSFRMNPRPDMHRHPSMIQGMVIYARVFQTIGIGLLCMLLGIACARHQPEFVPVGTSMVGLASWYGPEFHGKRTASGEIFDMNDMVAAHRTLPFGTYVRVTNLENGRSVIVRIIDRGPWKKDRIIDLSYAAARALGMIEKGVVPVRIEVVEPRAVATSSAP